MKELINNRNLQPQAFFKGKQRRAKIKVHSLIMSKKLRNDWMEVSGPQWDREYRRKNKSWDKDDESDFSFREKPSNKHSDTQVWSSGENTWAKGEVLVVMSI